MKAKKIKDMISRIIFLAVTLFVILAYILYEQGYYEIAFIKRDTVPEDETEQTIAQDEITDENSAEIIDEPITHSENLSQVTNPENIEGITQSENMAASQVTYKDLIAKIEHWNSYKDSWVLSDGVYNKNTHKLVRITPGVEIPNVLSYRRESLQITEYNSVTKTYQTTEKINTVTVVRTYMGFILIDTNPATTLLNSDGRLLQKGIENFSPAYTRDEINHKPVFYRNNETVTADYDKTANTFQLSPIKINSSFVPGLYGNYTHDYGIANAGLMLFYEDRRISTLTNKAQVEQAVANGEYIDPIYKDEVVRLFGYMNAGGTIVIPAQFYYAYNFSSNGLAVVADNERNISIINQSGNVVINPKGNQIANLETGRTVVDGYMLPDTFMTEEKKGMLYYDHGLLRVRRVLKDFYNGSTANDYDILINANGQLFDIPIGYELISYSNGILTLKKGNHYGCLDYTGKWIAQPIYTYVSTFSEGLAVIGFSDGKKGLIDTEGNIVLPFIFDTITEMSSGVIAAYEKENGWTVFNKIIKEG